MEARLLVVRGKASKRDIPLKLPTVIGRSRQADLPVAHALVSRQHCQLFEREGVLVVKDNGSLNGTFVGGQRVDEVVLQPGDELTVGPLTFQVLYQMDGFVPAQDATSTPADDSTVASPPAKAPTVPVPAEPGQAPAGGLSPFDFLESEADAPNGQSPTDQPAELPSAPPAEASDPSESADIAEIGDMDEPLSLPEPRAAQEATLQWSAEAEAASQSPPVERPSEDTPPVLAPPVLATPLTEPVAKAAPIVEPPQVAPPAEEDSDEEASVEEDPVEEDPVEEDPVEEDPVEEDSVEEDSVEEDSVEETNLVEPADFFASLALNETQPPTAAEAETEFFVAPQQPEIRDDDSTIIEPEPEVEPVVTDSAPEMDAAPEMEADPPAKSATKGQKKSGGWWPFGKKKAAAPAPKKPVAKQPGTPTAAVPGQSDAIGNDEPDQVADEPEFSNIPEFTAPADSASQAPATVEQQRPAPGNIAQEVLEEGVPAPSPKPTDDAEDLVAGWLTDEEPQSGPSASGSGLNNFLKNFPK